MNSFSQAVITVVGQNHGAKKTDRMQKAIIYSILQVTVVGAIVSFTLLALTPTLVQFFINPEQGNPTLVTDAAVLRCSIILSTYFLCGIMDSLAGFMRAVGCAFVSMIVSLSGACLLRIIWVKLIFPINPVQTTLYLCYPITWGVTAITLAICCIFFIKKFKKQQGATI
jgi:Na+-driven multidrug efflux pump